mgnify:FL=1
MIPVFLVYKDLALLLLRLVIAGIFLAHGWPKLKNLKTTMANFNIMGFKPGWLWGTYVALLETVGALMLILGVGTQIVALLLAGQMAVAAIWQKRQGKGLIGGYELDLLLVAASLALATSGGGMFALIF